MTPKINLTGQRFGRLVVVAEVGREDRKVTWLCRCDCGAESIVRSHNLRSGHTTSCGCWKRQVRGTWTLRHGQSHTPIHRSWLGAIQRTTNPNHPDYKNYGGRGITICPDWLASFEAFERDMGPTHQDGLTLDRIDVNGNYEPQNCRWATWLEQGRNKRNNLLLTHDGQTMPLSAWAERTGFDRNVISSRLRYGWSVERALTQPAQKRNDEPLTIHGETLPLAEWAKRSGVSRKTIADRLSRGWSAERAVSEPPRKSNRTHPAP